ncbi:MAG: CbiX/SirB N-terminal domain-containing protein, partial [Planctomycetota bacterium]
MRASVMLGTEIVNWEQHLVEENRPLSSSSPVRHGYLLVGHGTRREDGQQQFKNVFEQFAEEIAPSTCAMAFLELADPDIPSAIEQLAQLQVSQITVVPVLLFEAGHALEDIPVEVSKAANRYNIEIAAQTGAFKSAKPVLELSALRFFESLRGELLSDDEGETCDKSFAGNDLSAKVALLMIGRGSNSPTATAEMRNFTKKRCELTPVSWSQTGFIHGQRPTVEEAFAELEARPEPNKVVQPHLIFEGLLSQEIEERVQQIQKQNPGQRWFVT